MKLVRVGPIGAEIPGVLLEDGTVVDVSSVTCDFGPAFFADSDGLRRLREIVASGAGALPTLATDGVRLGPPIARPHKLLCIGLNYADHAEEANLQIPEEPILFAKGTNTIVGPNDTVLLPRTSQKTDWEVELALIIGKVARYLPDEASAMDAIAGYAVSNDVSERAFQIERGGQWIKGKSCETFNPLGPWIVTRDEIDDPQKLGMSLSVNGQVMQEGNTATMIFSPAHIVWYLSQFMVLEPGDVINTGTPPGVGMGMSPPRFLHTGDVMELEIDGLGQQRQVCAQA